MQAPVCLEACIPCRVGFPDRRAWAGHSARKHGYRCLPKLLASGRTCLGCGKVYRTPNRLMCHLRAVKGCQVAWGAFCSDSAVEGPAPHPQAPPSFCPGQFLPGEQLGLDYAVSLPLLAVLRDLDPVTDEAAWAAVSEVVEPLEVLRNTVLRWQEERASEAASPETPANVLLLLDPQLICDTFRRPKAPPAPDADNAAPVWSRVGLLPASPAGLRHCFSVDEPPGANFGYPFCSSVTARDAHRQALWVETACQVLGQAFSRFTG